jgi:phosphatidylserine/phosphatidylglycerophosphate/cardiolipin synthase-like enzyme
MSDRKWLRSEVAHGLKDLFREDEPASDLQQAYREAASVLATFRSETLNPVGGIGDPETALRNILDTSEPVPAHLAESGWTLTVDARRGALKKLIDEGRVAQALAANPERPRGPLQETLESYLLGNPIGLERMDSNNRRAALEATLQVSDWLHGIVEVPDVRAIQQRVEMEAFLKPFRDLVGDLFAGRDDEMDKLTDYVGIFDASTFRESVVRGIESARRVVTRDPLFILAPGGLGKSTLIAQFILTHAAAQYIDRFPFAYLDFDRPGLLVEEPVTLLVEVVRQFGIQYPEAAQDVAELRRQWTERIKEAHSVDFDSIGRKIFRVRDRAWYYDTFARFVNSIKTPGKAVLVVLDTFEEVQYRSGAYVEEVFGFLAEIQNRVPELRTVLAGRAPVKTKRFSIKEMVLPPFDKESARAFLSKQGVKDHALAVVVADQVGGSPLTLRLAAQLLSVALPDEIGPEGIRGLGTGVFDRIIGESVDAQLYSRILDHIRDPEVQLLAHPGLILRRLTADLIFKVLAGVCGVEVPDLARAEDLFNRFSKEITLVDSPEAGVLEHRQDVRSVMLGLMRKKDPLRSRQISDRAVEYYAARRDVRSRGEELYHRLLFEDYSRALVESRLELEPIAPSSMHEAPDRIRGWATSQMSSSPLGYVQRSIQELPDRSKAFVAAHSSSELQDEIWRMADLEDWELRTTRLALESIAIGRPAGANEFLRQRRERSLASPLYAIDVYVSQMAKDPKGVAIPWARFLEAAKRRPSPSFVLDALMWAPEVSSTSLVELAPLADYFFQCGSFDPGFPAMLSRYLSLYNQAPDQELLKNWVRRAADVWPGSIEDRPELREVMSRPAEAPGKNPNGFDSGTSTIPAMQPTTMSAKNSLNRAKLLVETHRSELQKQPGIVDVQPGFKTVNDWPTKEPAIIVTKAAGAATPSLPADIDGIDIEVREATDVEQLRHDDPSRYAALAAKHSELATGAFEDAAVETAVEPEVLAKPQEAYTPPKTTLKTVSGNLTFNCHASPDAGWPTLRAFLSKTKSRLTVGLYDFTSEHILKGLEEAMASGQKLEITLDNPPRNPTADQTDTQTLKALKDGLGESLTAAWAPVRSNKAIEKWIFPTAYHIKVAVRDGSSVWLSSGNWNNSNQPDMDPINDPQSTDQATAKKSDRDWHVVIDDPDIAAQYEEFLKHDNEVARTLGPEGAGLFAIESPEEMPPFELEAKAIQFEFRAPLVLANENASITPLLTPDRGVYQPAMLELIQSAKSTLYIQLQYIHPSNKEGDSDFTALIDAVAERINGGVDVRIICSQFQVSNGWLDRLQTAGIDLSRVKIQNGVHNKGFVIDSKRVALGSQNWSADGVLRNRDASVIIDNPQAAAYFEQIFLHDWDRIARQSMK